MRPRSASPRIRLALAGAALAGAAACGGADALSPEAAAGTYVLRTLDGAALPQSWGERTPATGGAELVADTLVLAADGTLRRTVVEHAYPGYQGCYDAVCRAGRETRAVEGGTWAPTGAGAALRLTGRDTAGSTRQAARLLRARLAADGTLTYVDSLMYPGARTFVYRR